MSKRRDPLFWYGLPSIALEMLRLGGLFAILFVWTLADRAAASLKGFRRLKRKR